MSVRVTALVDGRVQNVGFRAWARREAVALGLTGSATNLPDGRVEVIAEGPRADCAALLDVLRSGSSPGWVGSVDESWSDATGVGGFAVR